VLTREACLDAARRRIVAAIVVIALLSLLAVESCTSCTPSFVVDGKPVAATQLAGWSAALVTFVLGAWTLVLAGVLAAGHLAAPLDEGSAALVLARPVPRWAYALSRLAGALAVAYAIGGLLLGGAAALVHVRLGVPLGAALWASAACAAGSLIVAAIAMLGSLFLPQAATVLLVLLGVAGMCAANLASLFGAEPGGVVGALDRYGPPIAQAIAIALAPWLESARPAEAALAAAGRLALWAIVSIGALLAAFAREEIR
jgi:ABC-type transport system involved in multi-copper enzyme maturation permease subunit